MKSRILPNYNRENNEMARELQDVQNKIELKAAEIEKKDFISSAGGGAVKVSVKGDKTITSITFSPEIFEEKNVEVLSKSLQDLLISALNGAFKKVDEHTNEEFGTITKRFPIQGIFGV